MVTLPGGSAPAVVTTTLPLGSVVTALTYFDVAPSHPQLPAVGAVPPAP